MGAKLNLDFYSGADYYSDGDVENDLLEIVKKHKSYDEILQKETRWPILYHLSPIRHNIINWYPFDSGANCLEIGGGCGAITGALCDKLSKVTTVELSKRRATILYERHKTYDNLEVMVGNLNDIAFQEKFDYITLNGVLEYAGSFTKTEHPYRDFLQQIKSYLKPEGKLMVAIENRYGLKYFAGAKEDHTGKAFDGIVGYPETDTVRTFGKRELELLLEESGYPTQTFYYPHPDYKMPLEIYSDSWLPSKASHLMPAPNFDFDKYELFNDTAGFQGIIENGQFPFFANSFLVICGA
jgi:2-polyprenyl-3-methyl-5-hydroxy-6-metoxy-1,4-benzoquinol methylase